MRARTVNYLKQNKADGIPRPRGQIVNTGFFLYLRRPLVPCRLIGHRPVVDGTTVTPAHRPGYRPARWVVCDRCGCRPTPQGALDYEQWNIGDRYTGPWGEGIPERQYGSLKDILYPPGPWKLSSRDGELGGQLLIGGSKLGGVGVQLKVGNGGSEHTLAADFHLGWLGSLYLWTSGFGMWLHRRLNPVGYDSRLIGLVFRGGTIDWKLWAKRDNWQRADPWWQHGTLDLRVLDKALGRLRYDYENVEGGDTARLVRMPESDYLVSLQLQRVTYGRRRRRKRMPWSVEWEALGKGIPTKGPLRGRIYGSGVEVSDRSVRAGTWPAEAAAHIAFQVAEWRSREGWEPTGNVQIPEAARS